MKNFIKAGLVVSVLTLPILAQTKARFLFGDGEARYTTLPPDPTVNAASAGTIQNWSGSFVSGGSTFNYTMVGTNPASGSATTIVPTVIIPVKFVFSDGTSLDPTTPACGDSQSAVSRILNSPIFQNNSFSPGGTNVGNTQYIDAFQRANFWSSVSTVSPDYHVLLQTNPAVNPVVTINIPRLFGKAVSGPCSKIGEVSINYFNNVVTKQLLTGVPTTSLPIIVSYNTFWTQAGGCCILGYHSATGTAPNQGTYSVAAYSDPGIFTVPIQDIHALSHEIGEWLDDPYINNTTPGWTGGQVSGCSTALEVGDPVTGTAFTVTQNGFTYHPEDLVFLPFFAKQSVSNSVNGWFTFLNTLAGPINCN